MALLLHSTRSNDVAQPPPNPASTLGLTGWAAMAKTVRDLDEEKVRDCKEDIDTLLVFAGLFSAVLTAFLIESYHFLLPLDSGAGTNTELTGLLREIAMNTRGNTTEPGFFNAASASQSTREAAFLVATPYSPPLSAIRINSLWFSSLVFSLATASFGMLVKQWLREYLACEYTSPRARLRIRQRRNPSIRIWKVFQIAAVLPLLLQLSLALFFAGLCAFTWTIDRQVARPTIGFVCAWAFFLFASVVLPIFFPGCPYKTTAFLRVTRLLRSYVIALRNCVGHASPNFRLSDRTSRLCRLLGAAGTLIAPGDYEEEEKVAQDQSQDVKVLISVDAALTDDTILETTIWEALQQLHPDPRDELRFLFDVIKHRLPLNSLGIQSPHVMQLLDLRSLSPQAWEAVTDIAGSLLSRGLESSAMRRWSEETADALLIFLSYSNYALPARHIPLLQQCFQTQHWSACMAVLARQVSLSRWQAQEQILRCFRVPLTDLPLETALTHLARLTPALMRVDRELCPLWRLFLYLGGAPPNHDGVWHVMLDTLSDLATIAMRSRDMPMSQHEFASLQSLIAAILCMPMPSSLYSDFCAVIRRICRHPDGVNGLLALVAVSPSFDGEWTIEHSLMNMGRSFELLFDDASERSPLKRILTECQTHIRSSPAREVFLDSTGAALCDRTDRSTEFSSATTIDYVRLCRVYLSLQLHVYTRDVLDPNDLPATTGVLRNWQELWNASVLALAKFAIACGDGIAAHSDDAFHCFRLLQLWYRSDPDLEKAYRHIDPQVYHRIPFPDALFAALSLFTTSNRALRDLDGIQPCLDQSDMLSAAPEWRLYRRYLRTSTLWEYLRDSGFRLELLWPRLLSTLSVHIPAFCIDDGAKDLPNLTTLNDRASLLVTDIAAAVILRGLPEDLDNGPPSLYPTKAMQGAFVLLLSRFAGPVSPSGIRAIAACLRKRIWPGMARAAIASRSFSRDHENITHILHRIGPSAAQVPDSLGASDAVLSLAHRALCDGEQCPHGSVLQCLWEHRGLERNALWYMIRDILMGRVGDLVHVASRESTPREFIVFDHANCCHIPEYSLPEFHRTLRQLLLHPTNPSAAAQIYRPVVVLSTQARLPSFAAITAGIRSTYMAADEAVRHQLVRVFRSIPRDYIANNVKLDEAFDYIRVCLLHLEIYRAHYPLDAGETFSLPTLDLRERWSELWATTVTSLRKFAKEEEVEPAEECELALECFALLDRFEGRNRQASSAESVPPPYSSDGSINDDDDDDDGRLFPDELYTALAAFIPVRKASKLSRFENIQQRLPASHRRRTLPITAHWHDLQDGSAGAYAASSGEDPLTIAPVQGHLV